MVLIGVTDATPAADCLSGSASALALVEQLRHLQTLTPANQLQALLETDQAAQLVAAMAPQDLYSLAVAGGKEEAIELLPFCAGEQLVALTDLAGWQGYHFDLIGFEDWLSLIFSAGPETLNRYLEQTDLEQVLLYLNNRVRVHEADEDGDFPTLANSVEGEALWQSPDRCYYVEIFAWDKRDDRPPSDPIRPLLKHLEGVDPFALSRLFAALKWELATPLEEDCLRLRNSRMEELGFPPLDEAVQLLARGRPDQILALGRRALASQGDAAQEGLVLRVQARRDLLGSALAGLAEPERAVALAELAYTANQAMVADGVVVGSPAQVRAHWLRLRATISLGLEYAVRSSADAQNADAPSPTTVLRQTHPRALFRAGYNLILPLRDLALRLRRDQRSGPGLGCPWLNSAAQTLIDGLAQPRPVYLRQSGEEGLIEDLITLHDVARRLGDQSDLMAGVFSASLRPEQVLAIPCEGTNISQHADLSLMGLQRTAEAFALIYDETRIGPLPVTALKILRERLEKAHPLRQLIGDATDPRFVAPLWMRL